MTAPRPPAPGERAPIGPPPDWTDEQIAAASVAEIAAGRLPLRAQWRINEQRHQRDAGEAGAFTSALSVQEFAAIRSVGFSPVGQVMGSAVYNVGWTYSSCGYGYGFGNYRGLNTGGFSGYGMGAPVAPVVDVPAVRQLLEQARHRAVERMRTEAAGLGGDGVVGVRLTVRSFYGNGMEFMAIGTAVRADGSTRPKKPFTSDLSGQDFAKLIRSGWVPIDLVQGVGAVMRHDDWTVRMQSSSWSNQELVGSTQLVTAARQAARKSLADDAAKRGAHTVVLQDMRLNHFHMRCVNGGEEAHDQLADVFLWGTAIVPIGAKVPRSAPPPIPMLRLDKKGDTR